MEYNGTSLLDRTRSKLLEEGFRQIYIWVDNSGKEYSPHVHNYIVAHAVIEGEMRLTTPEGTKILTSGDRVDTMPEVLHSIVIGSSGCRYLTARKSASNK